MQSLYPSKHQLFVRSSEKRKKRHKPDRELPSKLDTYVPESRIHSQLLNFQRRLDSDTKRYSRTINDLKNSNQDLNKIFRVLIYNSYENQS